MEYRTLGQSDFQVSAIGLGCWEISGAYGHIVPDDFVQAVHRALDLGVTFFDTAPAYGAGASEEALGAALHGRRARAIISTKVGHGWLEGVGWYRDSSRGAIVKSVEDSLRRLQTDYVDYLQIHWPDTSRPFEEAMGAMNEVLQSGKVRRIGVSNFSSEQLRTCAALAPLIANQVGYNLFDRRWEYEMFPTAQELGLGIIAYGPLAHGLLTGALSPATVFESNDWRATYDVFGQHLFDREHFAQNLRVVEELRGVAHDLGTTVPCLALAWVLRHPLVACALCGTRRPAEIEENIKALDVRLAPDVLQHIDTVMAAASGQTDQIPR